MQSLTLIGKHWHNRSTGATSHRVEIIMDGHAIAHIGPMTGDYQQNAIDWLEVSGLIPAETERNFPAVRMAKLGIAFHSTAVSVANKSDL